MTHGTIFENNGDASRREFMRLMAAAGMGSLSMGGLFASCATEDPGLPPDADLLQAYLDTILNITDTILTRELDAIHRAAAIVVQSKLNGNTIYAHLTGGMVQAESAPGRPGSPAIFMFEDHRNSYKGDVVVSNDPSAVQGLAERWIHVIGLTSPWVPQSDTPSGILNSISGLRMVDVSELVIDCHIPPTDGVLDIQGFDAAFAPVSGIIHTMVYYTLVAEIMEQLTNKGVYPDIG